MTVALPAVAGAVVNPGVNGTYTIPITNIAPGSNPDIRITFGRDTLRDSPLSQVTSPGGVAGWSLGLRAGLGMPTGSFGSTHDPGFALDIDLERALSPIPNLAVQIVFGYNQFPADSSGGASDLDVTRLSGNLKWYVPVAPAVRLFVNGGAGAYWFSPGSSEAGTNAGAGLKFDLSSRIAIEGAYNLHIVSGSGESSKFSTLQGGVRIRF